VGFDLHFDWRVVFRWLLGLYQGLRPVVAPTLGRQLHVGTCRPEGRRYKEIAMDYIIAGIAALFLFGYLVYALLRPEKF
jgi:K+-transporting ATPase KdpF subunit